MKNRLLKTALGLSIFILLVLGSSHSARAATLFDYHSTETPAGYGYSSCQGGVFVYNNVGSLVAPQVYPGATSSIMYLGMYVKVDPVFQETHPTSTVVGSVDVYYSNSDGDLIDNSDGVQLQDIPSGGGWVVFTLHDTRVTMADGIFSVGVLYPSGSTAEAGYTSTYDDTNSGLCSHDDSGTSISMSPIWAIYDSGGPPPTIHNAFDSTDPAWIAYYQNQTLTGTCVHNGTDELALTIGRGDGSIDNVTSPEGSPIYNGEFNIDCVDNAWTATIGSGSDGVQVLLVDKNDYNNISNWVYGPQFDTTGEAPNEIQWDPIFENLAETNDFNNWLVEAGIGATTSPDQYEAVIDYATEDYSTTTAFTWQDIGPLMSASQVNNSFSGISIPKTIPLPEGNYKARAYLDDYTASTTIAESDFIHFSVVYSTSTSPATDYPNSQTPASQAVSQSGVGSFSPNCNEGNAVVNGLCTVLAYLLMPKESDLTQFQSLFTGIENKPPFGYFTSSEEAIASLATSTPAASLGALSLLSIFFSPIRIGFTLLIFFLAGLWLFNRLRHFNFQS